jgi:hypothetical protein
MMLYCENKEHLCLGFCQWRVSVGGVKPSTATPAIVAISVDISLSMAYAPSTAQVVGFASERLMLLSQMLKGAGSLGLLSL